MKIERLPADIRYTIRSLRYYDPKKILKEAGVRFLGMDKNDPRFLLVVLPLGWKIHYFVSNILVYLIDEKGRRRADIFFEETTSSKIVTLVLRSRYDYELDPNTKQVSVMDCGQVIQKFTSTANISEVATELAKAEARAHLDKNYPDWQNPAAYWD